MCLISAQGTHTAHLPWQPLHAPKQDRDPAALGAALDALRSDDAGKLGRLLQTQGWIRNEVVYANGESAAQDRLDKGWSLDIAMIPVILIESLERRGLRQVGDTLLEIAKKSGKSAVWAKLGGVDEVHAFVCAQLFCTVQGCSRTTRLAIAGESYSTKNVSCSIARNPKHSFALSVIVAVVFAALSPPLD